MKKIEPCTKNLWMVEFPEEMGIKDWWFRDVELPDIDVSEPDRLSRMIINMIVDSSDGIRHLILGGGKPFNIGVSLTDGSGNRIFTLEYCVEDILIKFDDLDYNDEGLWNVELVMNVQFMGIKKPR